MRFAAWQDRQVIAGKPEGETHLQFGDPERIFCIGEMICWDCYCFTAGSWRFAGLNCASSVVASYISNVQPHLLLFAASRECFCCCRWCGVLGVSVSPTATLRHTQCLVLWYFSFLFICGGGMSVVSCKVERWKRKRAQVTYKMDHASIVTILYFFWKKVFIYLYSKAFFGLFFIYEYIKLTIALQSLS